MKNGYFLIRSLSYEVQNKPFYQVCPEKLDFLYERYLQVIKKNISNITHFFYIYYTFIFQESQNMVANRQETASVPYETLPQPIDYWKIMTIIYSSTYPNLLLFQGVLYELPEYED